MHLYGHLKYRSSEVFDSALNYATSLCGLFLALEIALKNLKRLTLPRSFRYILPQFPINEPLIHDCC